MPLGRIIPKARKAASHPTSHKRHGDTRLATAPDRPTRRVSQSPEAWQKQAIEFLLWERSTIPPLSSVPEQSAAEADRAANALRQSGLLNWSGYFLAFLACRFSFSVF